MKRVRNASGKALSKFDMVFEMLHADHTQTKHNYWYYDTYYIGVDAFTYEEIANIYINEYLVK